MSFKVVLLCLCLLSCAAWASAADYYFPIIASGSIANSDQFYATEFVINNSSATRINAVMLLFTPQGDPLETTLRTASASGPAGTETNSLFQITIPPKGVWRGYLTQTDALKTGWATISSDDVVSTVAIFSLNSKTTGLISEAAVFASPAASVQRIFADTTARRNVITQLPGQTPSSDTGLAIANISPQTVSVTIRLLDSSGVTSRTTVVSLPPLSSISKFLKEFFQGLSTFQGTVELQSDVPVAALGLRYTGLPFTTIPVSVAQ